MRIRIAAAFLMTAACSFRSPHEEIEYAIKEHAAGHIATAEKSFARACAGGFTRGCVGEAYLVWHRKPEDGEPVIRKNAAAWLAACKDANPEICSQAGTLLLEAKIEIPAGKALLGESCKRGSALDCRARGESEGDGNPDARPWFSLGCDKNDGLSCVRFALVSGPDKMEAFSRGKKMMDAECAAGNEQSCKMAKAIEKGLGGD